MPFTNPIVGGTALVRPAINSPDYQAGVRGWALKVDGSSEFGNAVVRGTVQVGPAGSGQVVIDNTLTAALTAYYNPKGNISTATVRMLPGGGAYHYQLTGVDLSGEPFIAMGLVTAAGAVSQTWFAFYNAGSGIEEIDLLDPARDTRLVVTANFAQFGNGKAGNVQVDGALTVGTTISVTGDTTIGGDFNYDANQAEWGQVTAGSVATATVTNTEVAVPAASWAHEPNPVFSNGSLYRLELQYGLGLSVNAVGSARVRIRKGSASTSGQLLGETVAMEANFVAFHSRAPLVAYVKNVSGADITTALSVTITRTQGTPNMSLYGDALGGTWGVPFNLTIERIGTTAARFANLAVAIV